MVQDIEGFATEVEPVLHPKAEGSPYRGIEVIMAGAEQNIPPLIAEGSGWLQHKCARVEIGLSVPITVGALQVGLPATGPAFNGFPTTFGRSEPTADRDWSVPSVSINGEPLEAVKICEVVQPPRIRSIQGFESFGICTTSERFKS